MNRTHVVSLLVLSLVACGSLVADEDVSAGNSKDMMTRWGRGVTPENAWTEYPRPQMVRENWVNLNGLWEYAITPRTAGRPEDMEGKILVPYAVESSLSGVKRTVTPADQVWYRRSFSPPDPGQDGRVLLHFGAVDYSAVVFVNGAIVGSHEGGFDAFSFDITDYLLEQDNVLEVRVADPSSTGEQPRGKQRLDPLGIWYTPVTGIWQTVWLEPVPGSYIQEVRHTPDIDSGTLQVEVLLNRSSRLDEAVRVTAIADGKEVSSAQGPANRRIELAVPDARLWSPVDPFLYDLRVELVPVKTPYPELTEKHDRHGQKARNPQRLTTAEAEQFASAEVSDGPLDSVMSYFGMRKSSIGQGIIDGQPALQLNNRPLFHNGPLDQGWWPDGLHTPPSDEAIAFEMEFLKAAGFNMLRKHIKVEPARYYYHADRLGLMIWQDMPNGFDVDETGSNRDLHPSRRSEFDTVRRAPAEEQFELELRRMMNRLHNHPSIVMWVPFNEGWGQYDTARIAHWVKAIDPSRVVNAISGWLDVGDEASEVFDIHTYHPVPQAPQANGKRAIVLGEFGGVGWPVEGHLWNPDMRNWGYQTYHTFEEVLAAYRTKYEEAIRQFRELGLSAVVYTQTSDVEGEVNGLLTYDREVIKIPVETLSEIHAPLFR